MIAMHDKLPIWLRARQASRLMGLSLLIGAVSGMLVDTTVPLPASLTINPPTVPVVTYLPVAAVLLTAWQVSLRCEPNEALSSRPVGAIRAGTLLAANGAVCNPIILAWWTPQSPWALVGARNFLLVIWGTVLLTTILGLRLGTAIAALGTLLVPSLTRTDHAGASLWWALSEAPATSTRTLVIGICITGAGLLTVLTNTDRRPKTWLPFEPRY